LTDEELERAWLVSLRKWTPVRGLKWVEALERCKVSSEDFHRAVGWIEGGSPDFSLDPQSVLDHVYSNDMAIPLAGPYVVAALWRACMPDIQGPREGPDDRQRRRLFKKRADAFRFIELLLGVAKALHWPGDGIPLKEWPRPSGQPSYLDPKKERRIVADLRRMALRIQRRYQTGRLDPSRVDFPGLRRPKWSEPKDQWCAIWDRGWPSMWAHEVGRIFLDLESVETLRRHIQSRSRKRTSR
jgi:hypothetical protein